MLLLPCALFSLHNTQAAVIIEAGKKNRFTEIIGCLVVKKKNKKRERENELHFSDAHAVSILKPKIYIIICEFIYIINIFHFIWYFQYHCAAIETTHKLEFLVFKLIHLFRCSGQCKNSKLSRVAEMIAHTHADMHAETLTCRTIKAHLLNRS